MLTTADRLVLGIALLALATAGVLAGVAGFDPPPGALGVAHPDYPSMLRGGDGAARVEGMLGWGWAFGALQPLFFAACFALGLLRPAGLGVRRWLWLALAVHELLWLGFMWTYAQFAADPQASPLVGGFPLPTAVMLYGLWPYPLVYVAIYSAGFARHVFGPDEQRRLDELVARRREGAG